MLCCHCVDGENFLYCAFGRFNVTVRSSTGHDVDGSDRFSQIWPCVAVLMVYLPVDQAFSRLSFSCFLAAQITFGLKIIPVTLA